MKGGGLKNEVPPRREILIQWVLGKHQNSQFSMCFLEDTLKFFQQQKHKRTVFLILLLRVKILKLLNVVYTQNKMYW